MNKKVLKIITIVLTVVLCIVVNASLCYAEIKPGTQLKGDMDLGENLDDVSKVGNKVATIIRNVGIVISVIILMILGIKYMMGSAEEKAEYKKTMIPYVVGAIVLFGATQIAGAVIGLAKSF